MDLSNSDYSCYLTTLHNAKTLKEALINGTATFLPDDKGKLNSEAIYNLNTGYITDGVNLLMLQHQKKTMGYSSNVVGTMNTIQAAKTVIKRGEKGVGYNFLVDNEYRHGSFLFPEQTEHPERLQNYRNKKLKDNKKLTDQNLIVDKAEEYLPSYFAAAKGGMSVTVKPEATEEFKKRFIEILDNTLSKKRNPKIPVLSEFCFSADKAANQIIKDKKQEINKLAVAESSPLKNKQKGIQY